MRCQPDARNCFLEGEAQRPNKKQAELSCGTQAPPSLPRPRPPCRGPAPASICLAVVPWDQDVGGWFNEKYKGLQLALKSGILRSREDQLAQC